MGTDPWNPETDGDGFGDGWEAERTWSPTNDDRAVVDYIKAHTEKFGLYTLQQVADLAVGGLTIDTTNGTVRLRLQLQESDDVGGTWTNAGSAVNWELPVTGDRKVFRIRAGE